jgi:lambda family phage tail tape measure protein
VSFDYEIKASATQALAVSRQVEESLERVLKSADNAGEGFARAARAAADNMGRAMLSAQQRAADLDSRLNSMRGFDALTEHLKREADVLERIRGPMREHAADVRALDTLYSRSAISAKEYTDELNRLRSTQGGGSGVGAVERFGNVAAGVGVGVGVAAANKALELTHSVGDLSESYQNLDNRLRSVTKSDVERNEVMSRTKEIANASRSEWVATGELYVRLSKATADMGISQSRVLGLTETISKAFTMSGASASEASAGMLQLSQAFSSGRLQGDEFRSLSEAVPDVMRLIAKEMHVTTGELKQLGSDGKITSDVLLSAFEHAKTSIDEGFAKTAPTLSQQWTVFKNEMTETIGKLVKDTDLLTNVGDGLKNLASAINSVASAYRALKDAKDFVGGGGGGEGDSTFVRATKFAMPNPMGLASRFANNDTSRPGLGVAATEENSATMDSLISKFVDLAKETYATAKAQGEYNAQMDAFLAKTGALATTAAPASADQIAKFEATVRSLTSAAALDTTAWGDWNDKIGETKPVTADATQILGGIRTALVESVQAANLFGDSASAAFDTVATAWTESDLGAQVDMVATALGGAGQAIADLIAITNSSTATIDDWLVAADKVPLSLANIATTTISAASALSVQFGTALGDIGEKLRKWNDTRLAHHQGLSLEEKLYKDIKGPMLEYGKSIAALDDLLKKNRITTAEYRLEVTKLASQLGGFAKILDDLHTAMRSDNSAARGQGGILQGPGGTEETVAEFEHRISLEEKLAQEQREAASSLQPDLEKDLALFDKNAEATRKWHDEIRRLGQTHDVMSGIKKGLDDVYKEATDVSEVASKTITDAFHGMEDALVEGAMHGKSAWGDFLHQLESDLLRLAIRILEMRLLMAAFGGAGAGLGGSTFLLRNGGAHATGGSYTAPMTGGGPDSIPVGFLMSPGETAHFVPQGAPPTAGRGGGSVKIVNQWDRRALLDEVDSPEGERATVQNVVRHARRLGQRARS